MIRSLNARLAAILTVLFVATGVVFILLLSQATKRYEREVTQRLNASLAGHIAAEEELLITPDGVDQAALKRLFHMLMVINPNIELYLLDATGRILAYSAPPGKVRRSTVALEPIRGFLTGDYQPPLLGDDPRDPAGRKVFSVAPVQADDTVVGYLYVILASQQYENVAQMLGSSYVLKTHAMLVMVAVGFALVAGLLLFALLTRRLRHLDRAVAAFRSAEFTGDLPEPGPSGDEIDRLTRSVRDMAERIAAQLKRLEETDAQRRELVANVSHDLRTPLASLQGYLETLQMKDADLTPSERRHYLEVAHNQCDHLGRLIAELFELARLDANEVRPVLEPFPLPELIQDVLQKFDLRANECGVRLESRCDEALPMVVGDIALIERALDNLLDNALQHTPAGGTVAVVVEPLDQVLLVQVVDTGSGIPADQLPRVFERFYQTDESRAKNGAGLGLAIATRIVELHGSAMRAASEPGRGTVFSFDLPATNAT
jgi:two-component system OmpR family sensor kinase